MKNLKIISLSLLAVLTVVFVSCKSNENPTKFKPQDCVGTWQSTVSAGTSFQLTDTGNIVLTSSELGGVTLTFVIQDWDANKGNEFEQFAVTVTVSGYTGHFTFKNTSECDVTIDGMSGTEPFKKN